MRSATSAGLFLAATLFVSCASPVPSAPEGEVESALAATIDDSWRRHIEAAKQKDLEAVLEIYAADIVYVVPSQADVRGIAAVRAMEGWLPVT